MSKLDMVKKTIVRNTGRAGLTIKKYSPEILMGVGVAGVIGSTVLACKATLKLEAIVDKAKETLEDVEHVRQNPDLFVDSDYTDEDANRDKVIVYTRTAVEIAKLYAPAAAVGAVSVGALLGSHKIMKARNVAVVAAYKAVEESFNNYRRRVVREFGIDKDHEYRYGIIREEQEVTEKDEKTGKNKKVKKTVESLDPNHVSQYARFFDESCDQWSKTPEYNKIFVKAQQNHANDLLIARGHLFLNEVYDMLGMERSQAGTVVGWVVDEESDNFVDFGIYSGRNNDFVNGLERSILLDFNVDGVIYDLI